MSDTTTITAEERGLWASVATARINAVTPERQCEIAAQERLVKALKALEQAEAENARLRAELKQGGVDYCALMDRHDAQFVRAEQFRAEVDWLSKVCAMHCRDKSTDDSQCSISDCGPVHCLHASAGQWKEAARRAVAAVEETCQK